MLDPAGQQRIQVLERHLCHSTEDIVRAVAKLSQERTPTVVL